MRGSNVGRRAPHAVRWIAVALMLAGLGGCAGGRKPVVYLDENANFELVRRVAVMPFDNFTTETYAAAKVQQILIIELLDARAFEVVDTTRITEALQTAGVSDVSAMTPEQIGTVGRELGAQALMLGTVRELKVDRSSGVAAPSVSLHFELVDVESAETIWSTVVTREGVGAFARMFGLGGSTANEAIQKLVRQAIDTLIQ